MVWKKHVKTIDETNFFGEKHSNHCALYFMCHLLLLFTIEFLCDNRTLFNTD